MARTPVTDVVVVLPGITGSALADAGGKHLWNLSGNALWQAARTFGGSVKELQLPRDLGDDHPGDGVVATELIPGFHALAGLWRPVAGYGGLLASLQKTFTLDPAREGTPGNLLPFPYDWRLSCRYNAELLKTCVDRELGQWRKSAPERRDARVIFVCHSMGGLVARWYVECLGGHEITRHLITLGTPHRGSMNALDSLVNGMTKGWGPLSVDLSAFARSLPSLHQLAPDYKCVTVPGGLANPRDLPGLPGCDPTLLMDAGEFHAALRKAAAGRSDRTSLQAVVGVRQPTATTATYEGDRLVPLVEIKGKDEGGDGTVPRLAARPGSVANGGYDLEEKHTPCEHHGSLQDNPGVQDVLWQLLGRPPEFHLADDDFVPLGVLAPSLLEPGEPFEVSVSVPPEVERHDELRITAELSRDGDGTPSSRSLANRGEGRYSTTFPAPEPGGYRVVVQEGKNSAAAVTALTLVCGNGG
ncbi:esterase/lipase family protein [Streptomyces virginiae]|uniref:esterase/lipase family protein n=1 Tax=Streptomyces virginiae TaxID=1961 RepID=UPI0036796315